MISAERVFGLFVEANPVPDPDQFEPSPGLRSVIARDDADDVRDSRVQVWRNRRWTPVRGWRPAAVAALVTLFLGAAVSIVAMVRDTDRRVVVVADGAVMRVVFDGTTCRYNGPAHITTGEKGVRIERLEGVEPVAVIFARLSEPKSLEEIKAWSAVNSGQAIPGFVRADMQVEFLEGDSLWAVVPVAFERGQYVFTCATSPEGTNRQHSAALVQVTASESG